MFPRSVSRTPFTAAEYAAAGLPLTQREIYDVTVLSGDDIWDFSTLRGRPGTKDAAAQPVVGTTLKSMVYGGVDATIDRAAMAYDGKALVFDRTQKHNVNFGVRTPAIGDVFMHWSSATFFNPGSNNRLISFGAFQVLVIAGSDGKAQNLEFYAPNADVAPVPAALVAAKMTDGLIHCWEYALSPVATLGKYRIDVLLDKVIVGQSPEYTFGNPAAAQLAFGMGASPDPLFPMTGRLLRFRKGNTITANMSAAAMAAIEVDKWSTRLKA